MNWKTSKKLEEIPFARVYYVWNVCVVAVWLLKLETSHTIGFGLVGVEMIYLFLVSLEVLGWWVGNDRFISSFTWEIKICSNTNMEPVERGKIKVGISWLLGDWTERAWKWHMHLTFWVLCQPRPNPDHLLHRRGRLRRYLSFFLIEAWTYLSRTVEGLGFISNCLD